MKRALARGQTAMFILGIALVGCVIGCHGPSSIDEPLPATDAAAAPAEAAPGAPAASGSAPMAALPKPAPTVDYKQGDVRYEKTEGQVQFNAIFSEYPCKSASDCSFSKYENVPKGENSCMCAAACTPFVVSISERDKREKSNNQYCDPDDWYGPMCPAIPCRFQAFEGFKCMKGMCVGLAMGKSRSM